MPKAKREYSRTGRRPYRSLRFPRSGAKANWVTAKTTNSQPPQVAAALRPWPVSPSIKTGMTGMTMLNPTDSRRTVTKTLESAPLGPRADVASPDERATVGPMDVSGTSLQVGSPADGQVGFR